MSPALPRPAPRGAAGFTLLEVLVAAAITAFIGAMALGAFRQVDRAAEIARAQGDRYAGARVALTRLARELSMAYLSEHYDRGRLRERPTLFKGREDELLFTSFANVRLAPEARESDQMVVEYTVGADPDNAGQQALFRRAKARIDDEPDRGGRRDVVAEHVTGFQLRYWDEKRRDWSREWSTQSVDHAAELPSRVRLELEIQLADGRTEKFVTEARIALTRPLDF